QLLGNTQNSRHRYAASTSGNPSFSVLRQLQYLCELTQVYDEICPYRVARRVCHGIVFFTDIQGTVM
ncbi:hypothetical protein ACWJR6_28900, partial [Klebsiella pneumoniae]|uniref:hypothetical protein n=1 Tax=Klebsiella pneumoniae TaxID=573 RepID=UPI003B67CC07